MRSYGKRARAYVASGPKSLYRSSKSVYQKKKTAARAAKVSGKRKLASVSSRKTQIRRNTRAIKSLAFNQWGSIQVQSSTMMDDNVHLRKEHPLCFLVNNPMTNQFGPYLWTMSDIAGQDNHAVPTGHRFTLYGGENQPHDVNKVYHQDAPNGDRLKLNWATFQFEFRGFVDCTHVRVDFVRQKKVAGNWFNPEEKNNFMPESLSQFNRIAGFDPSEIDRSLFEIIATRKIYMNSRGRSNALDTIEDRVTTDATTPGIRHCRVSLKLNKIIKQLRPSMSQGGIFMNIHENPNAEQSEHDGTPHGSAWGHNNQHPLSNIWCILSTDDETAISPGTGDNVSVKIIRKLTWQDSLR